MTQTAGQYLPRCLEGAVIGTLLGAAMEVFFLPQGIGPSTGLAVLGLWALLVPLVAVGLAILAWGGQGAAWQRLWARFRVSSARGQAIIETGVPLALAGIGLVLLRWGLGVIDSGVRGDGLVSALGTAYAAVLGIGFLILTGRVRDELVQRCGDRRVFAGPMGIVVVGVCTLPILYAVAPAAVALSMATPTGVMVGTSTGGVAALAWTVFGGSWSRRRTGALLALSVGAVGLGVSFYGADAAVRATVESGQGVAHTVASTLRGFSDADGDGYSAWLGGGDCDDSRADIHPTAAELPDNDVDEDCDGADLRLGDIAEPGMTQYYARGKALDKPWNFLVVTVEATRADHLSVYGYDRETSPTLAKLAKNGLVFERAYSPSNSTRYSIPTTFTGRYLADVDMDWVGSYLIVQPDAQTIFQRLQAAGWYTEALLPAQQLDGMWHGLERGFDAYVPLEDARLKTTSAPAINRALIDTLSRIKSEPTIERFALWTHYLEPHEPYRRYAKHDFGAAAVDRYDAEIAAFDAALGQIVDTLDALELRENTVIVVTSDHGEEFGEHGRYYHGHQLYDESLRVPLLIHIPGAPSVRVKGPVSTIDVAPTVGNLAGLAPLSDGGGRSHVGRLGGTTQTDDWRRTVFAESIKNPQRPNARQVMLLKWPYKVIANLRTKTKRVFDLVKDPLETSALTANAGAPVKEMSVHLRKELSRQKAARLKRVLARRVLKAPPGFVDQTGQAVLPGLEFLGGRLSKRRIGQRVYQQAQTWFRAGKVKRRPDLELRFALVSEEGKVLRWFRQRPLVGIYPMGAWKPGDVVELSQLLRLSRAVGRIRVDMYLYRGKERVFGPHSLGEIVHETAAPK